MRFYGRAIDQNLRRRTTSFGEGMKKIDPNALGSPTDIAVVESFLRAVFRRGVDPAAAGFQNMNNAADHTPVINSRFAARVGRKMPRNL